MGDPARPILPQRGAQWPIIWNHHLATSAVDRQPAMEFENATARQKASHFLTLTMRPFRTTCSSSKQFCSQHDMFKNCRLEDKLEFGNATRWLCFWVTLFDHARRSFFIGDMHILQNRVKDRIAFSNSIAGCSRSVAADFDNVHQFLNLRGVRKTRCAL